MIFGWKKRPKNIVIYSMAGDEAAAPIADMFAQRPDVRLFQVHTLERTTVAHAMLALPKPPAHLAASDQLLRDVLPRNEPVLFITPVTDPFDLHTRTCFQHLLAHHDPNTIGHALADPHIAAALFKALPAEETTGWFEREYKAATGIDVFAHPFDRDLGFLTIDLPPHRLLLVSSHLPPDRLAKTIAGFTGLSRLPATVTHPAPDPFLNLFRAQMTGSEAASMEDALRTSHMATHFFAPAQIDLFRTQTRALSPDVLCTTIHTAHKSDLRIARALSTFWQRKGAISRPLALLDSIPERDERMERDHRLLQGHENLLKKPFPFPARTASPAFTPAPKTVLYNPHQCLPFHTSGYATRTHGIVKGLHDCGWDMRVFARAGYPLDTRVDPQGQFTQTIDGIPYAYDDAAQDRPQNGIPLDEYVARATDYLVACAQPVRPRIIHTASNFICGLAGIAAARKLGLPSIYEMRGLWHITRWSKEPAYNTTDKFAQANKLELECAAAADHVLAITGALKEWLVEHGIDAAKISLAPNAVNLDQFQVRAPDADFARQTGCEGKIVVGYIGSFVQYEGLDLLVQAISLLPPDARRKIRLLWIGDGPVLPDLLAQAQDCGVRDNIISLGRRPFDEIPRAYSIVDIAAFPRKGQAICEIVSPLKPFEAMAMEKAVLVSDVRPLKEIITPGETGLVHAKDNASDLAEKLGLFIDDADLRRRCGAQARDWIEKTRQWNIIAGNIASIYNHLA